MIPTEEFKVDIFFKTGRKLKMTLTGTELNWLLDRMMKRTEGNFQNFDGAFVNVSEIECVLFVPLV